MAFFLPLCLIIISFFNNDISGLWTGGGRAAGRRGQGESSGTVHSRPAASVAPAAAQCRW